MRRAADPAQLFYRVQKLAKQRDSVADNVEIPSDRHELAAAGGRGEDLPEGPGDPAVGIRGAPQDGIAFPQIGARPVPGGRSRGRTAGYGLLLLVMGRDEAPGQLDAGDVRGIGFRRELLEDPDRQRKAKFLRHRLYLPARPGVGVVVTRRSLALPWLHSGAPSFALRCLRWRS